MGIKTKEKFNIACKKCGTKLTVEDTILFGTKKDLIRCSSCDAIVADKWDSLFLTQYWI